MSGGCVGWNICTNHSKDGKKAGIVCLGSDTSLACKIQLAERDYESVILIFEPYISSFSLWQFI